MKTNSTFLEQYSLPIILILAPLISLAIPLFLPLPSEVVPLVMVFIPALLAITLTTLTGGRKGVGTLLKKLFQWRVGIKWYVIALALALGLRLAMSVLALLLGLILPGQMNAGSHWLPSILYIIGLSVILTWLYIQTRENLVIPILFHAGQSFFVFLNGGITLTQQLWLLTVVAIAIALLLILLFGVNLQRGPVKKPVIVEAG